jgi:hypothetical protein
MNSLLHTATEIREHYLIRFHKEYIEQQEILATYQDGHKRDLLTDFEQYPVPKNVNPAAKTYGEFIKENKCYRHDIAITKNGLLTETVMCWPVIIYPEEESAEEDIPWFRPFHRKIIQTDIEIQPFPWFHCTCVFYPNAESVKGIIDLWFQRWFYSTSKPAPFLNVLHRMDGPYTELDGGESYNIDFGTAPPKAFCDLLNQVCKSQLKYILIR